MSMIRQTPVNEAQDPELFAAIHRFINAKDPDVILIGEIRDSKRNVI